MFATFVILLKRTRKDLFFSWSFYFVIDWYPPLSDLLVWFWLQDYVMSWCFCSFGYCCFKYISWLACTPFDWLFFFLFVHSLRSGRMAAWIDGSGIWFVMSKYFSLHSLYWFRNVFVWFEILIRGIERGSPQTPVSGDPPCQFEGLTWQCINESDLTIGVRGIILRIQYVVHCSYVYDLHGQQHSRDARASIYPKWC